MWEKNTYELENKNNYERIEWDDIWRENAPEQNSKRILLIGDSIFHQSREKLNASFNGEINVDLLATSKSVADSAYPILIDYMAAQYDRYDVVIFNNGLHGFYLDNDGYEENYRKLVKHIIEKLSKSKVLVSLSSTVRNPENINEFLPKNDVCIARNSIARKIAQENNIEYIDTYSLVCDRPDLISADGIHLNETGVEMLVEMFSNKIRSLI